MQVSANAQTLHERRSYKPEQSALWDRLNTTQKFAATSLTQFGYELTCIRKSEAGSIAILICGENVASINNDGDIDTTSKIVIREL